MLSDRPPYESSPHAAPAYAPGELLHVFLAPFSPMVFRRTFGVSSRGRGRPVTMHGAQANRGMRPDWSAHGFTLPTVLPETSNPNLANSAWMRFWPTEDSPQPCVG